MQYSSLGYKSTSGTFSSSLVQNSSHKQSGLSTILDNLTQKKEDRTNTVNVRLVNKNYARVNNFWNHDGFNHVIELLIAALDKYDLRTFRK